jgi:hypothetical protein
MMRHLVPAIESKAYIRAAPDKGGTMWWGIGFGGAILYMILIFTLGMMTLRNGHALLFWMGIFVPFLWLLGAFLRPTERAQSAY